MQLKRLRKKGRSEDQAVFFSSLSQSQYIGCNNLASCMVRRFLVLSSIAVFPEKAWRREVEIMSESILTYVMTLRFPYSP